MIRATVTGTVWATRRLNEIPNGAFLEVRAAGSEAVLVAFDVLGSGVGEEVLVVQGSVASAWFDPQSSEQSSPTTPDPASAQPGDGQ
jgi:ethanolamine utilization protein EutN